MESPIDRISKLQFKQNLPECGVGDQVRVWYRIEEQGKSRVAPFEGLIIRQQGSGSTKTLTIRRITYGEGVERIFPLHAPVLDRIEVLRRGKVKRARLYYLRSKVGKTRIAAANPSGISSAPTSAAAPAAEASESAQ